MTALSRAGRHMLLVLPCLTLGVGCSKQRHPLRGALLRHSLRCSVGGPPSARYGLLEACCIVAQLLRPLTQPIRTLCPSCFLRQRSGADDHDPCWPGDNGAQLCCSCLPLGLTNGHRQVCCRPAPWPSACTTWRATLPARTSWQLRPARSQVCPLHPTGGLSSIHGMLLVASAPAGSW